jgi:hypothetical protein
MKDQASIQTAMGNPKLIFDSIATGARSSEEILRYLDKFGIEWFVTEGGDLMIKSWTVAAQDFVTPEQAANIRSNRATTEYSDDLDWLSQNLEVVRRQFSNKWIAICENRIVGSSTSIPELMAQVGQFDKPLITFIPAEPTTWVSTYVC